MSAKRAKAGAPPVPPSRVGWAIGAVIAASFVAYANSFSGVWVFDDFASVVNNPSLRSLGTALFPPGGGLTVSGRPVLNLSFAMSQALGAGTFPHHVLNWLIHTAAALALLGAVRRTFLLSPVLARWREHATAVAGLTALLWVVHPLQTESVTYLVQRAESLMGLFFLLTFYCYVRSIDAPHPGRWWAGAIAACLLGVGTKEVIVTAPLLVLLHDRAFFAGSFAAARRLRLGLHAGLFATWLPLAALVLGTGGNRGGSVGFGAEADPLSYWMTQFEAVVQYLRLTVWPQPLVFEYGTFWQSGFAIFLPCVLIVTALVLATGWALVRRPALGWVGAWFFALLAPTSVMPGTTQMIVEHRMYLPLAGLLALAALGLWAGLGRRALLVGGAVAIALAGLTFRRNADYRDEAGLWADTLAKRPNNATAHDSFAVALARAGRADEALIHLADAARLAPTRADYLCNYGTALSRAGRQPEAIVQFQRALQLAPKYGLARINLGLALQRTGRTQEALDHIKAGVDLDPGLAEGHASLGGILVNLGRTAEAVPHLEKAVRLAPNYVPGRVNLGIALVLSERPAEAAEQLQVALRMDPNVAEAHNGLGLALLKLGRNAEALAAFEAAVRLSPDFAQARANAERLRGLLATPR